MIVYPNNYKHYLNVVETELAIKAIKDMFETELSLALNLIRVSAPLFVEADSGFNDQLVGQAQPVRFYSDDVGKTLEIVQSLAKWKRFALARYDFKINQGLYTDMNAIRKDEQLDNIHSILVDQWDWELIIEPHDRTLEKLKDVVRKIYDVLLKVEAMVEKTFDLQASLSKNIHFITSQALLDRYPDLPQKEREKAYAKQHGSVFVLQIGDRLSHGQPHEERAFDYDDWSLNGDLLIYYPLLEDVIELSSMGIRVTKTELLYQSKQAKQEAQLAQAYHQMVLKDQLPITIGGGIGQSRMCLILLKKAHIGEVQATTWPQTMEAEAKAKGIFFL
ncbi:MAG: aspartate--ammonia ligase [Erysipelothrix sp.]|nr:aspartate--ammonia ligase [Erysipelothrix sp.]